MNVQFSDGFASWRRTLQNAKPELPPKIVERAAAEAVGYVPKGLDQIEAVDELTAIAAEIPLDPDEAQHRIAWAFENVERVPAGGNGAGYHVEVEAPQQ